MKKTFLFTLCCLPLVEALTDASLASAQTAALRFTTTQSEKWRVAGVEMQQDAPGRADYVLRTDDTSFTFQGFGTCLNELGYDALMQLSAEKREELMSRMYDADGDLRYNLARLSVGANDYAREWYSYDETEDNVPDFNMEHFSIDRDRERVIPYAKLAQKYCPDMTFWASPWSPPQWMKTNKHYAQRPGGGNGCPFAVAPYFNDQFVMEPDYLNAYCLYFDKYIDAMKEEGIPVTGLAYQNEAYSNTVYPGCSWTAEGTGKFLAQYLGPYMKEHQPQLNLILGTINTGSIDVIETIINTPGFKDYINTVGFQWEGGPALPEIQRRYPDFHFVQTESQCNWGAMDWADGSLIFQLINHYLINGCETYTFWNSVLTTGMSTWGWQQSMLVRVNSDNTISFLDEWYAAKHFSHFITDGSKMLVGSDETQKLIAYVRPDGAVVLVVGNLTEQDKTISVDIDGEYISLDLPANSFNTCLLGDQRVILQYLLDETKYVDETTLTASVRTQLQQTKLSAVKALNEGDGEQLEASINEMQALLKAMDPAEEETGEIVNPSFTNGSNGWVLNNVSNGGDFRTNNLVGKSCWNNWSNNFTSMDIHQIVKGLIPGRYVASCVAMCGPGEITDQHLYVTTAAETTSSPVKQVAVWNTAEGWEEQTTPEFTVGSDGSLTIGYASTSGGGTAGWFCVTDFKLQRVGDATEEQLKEYDQKVAENGENVEEIPESVITEYEQKKNLAMDYAGEEDDRFSQEAKDALLATLAGQSSLVDQLKTARQYEDLINELNEAIRLLLLSQKPSETTDFTFAIQSPDVETFDADGNPQGWLISNTNGDAKFKQGQQVDGNGDGHYFDSYNGTAGFMYYTVSQTVKDIPNGTYRLTCMARSSGKGFCVFAGGDELTYQEVENYGNTGGPIWQEAAAGTAERNANSGQGFGWQTIVIDNIQVTDHQLTIGATTDRFLSGMTWDGTWCSADNFQLTYIAGDGEADGIDSVRQSRQDLPARYYNLQGMEMRKSQLPKGIYIVKQGDKSWKTIK